MFKVHGSLNPKATAGDRSDSADSTKDGSSAGSDASNACSNEVSKSRPKSTSWRISIALILIGLIGVGVSAVFVTVGVRGAHGDQQMNFENHAARMVTAIESSWQDYHLASLWIQEACRSTRTSYMNSTSHPRMCSRQDFRGLYEYMLAAGLEFHSIAYHPNVTLADRPAMEQESAQYYREHYPQLQYMGFIGFTGDTDNVYDVGPSPDKPFYFPQHLLEPVEGNEYLVDFDFYSSPYYFLLDDALRDWVPVITTPMPGPDPGTNQIFLLHPGAKLSTTDQERSEGLSLVTITFGAIVRRSFGGGVHTHGDETQDAVSVFVFDTTRQEAPFGAARIDAAAMNEVASQHDYKKVHRNDDHIQHSSKDRAAAAAAASGIEFLEDSTLEQVRHTQASLRYEHEIRIEQQIWTVVILADGGSYEPELTYVIMGGCFILAVCACFALWLYSAMRRDAQVAMIRRAADEEKSALIVASAQESARVERLAALAERHFNEYLSHEVRNPLTSAMSACSFLAASSSNKKDNTNNNDDAHEEDINVIRSSLAYIDDLLRSSLDMHKIQSKQLVLDVAPTDVLKDIFEPVRVILHRRENMYQIEIDCPENLVVMADRMRVKQVVLNLAGNSKKFVEHGFIRLRAKQLPNGGLQLSVEDSGPGIPQTKRHQLFERFQSSLDSLNQGTGMGLSLCKSLAELMKGSIELDSSYDSGVNGYPGTRFVISLPECGAVCLDSVVGDEGVKEPGGGLNGDVTRPMLAGDVEMGETRDIETGAVEPADAVPQDLPRELSVLVVDDDLVLRKLLCRSLKRVAPEWKVHEASNGETALVLAATHTFDLIFMDQYMASVEKQMLGTEAVYALRAIGVQSLICGLSANDMEQAFLKSGATAFLQKPFACEQNALRQDLLKVLKSGNSRSSEDPCASTVDAVLS